LEPDPKRRLNVSQVLEHPWFFDADDSRKPLLTLVPIFNSEEREVINREFTFNNPQRYIRNEKGREDPVVPKDGFTE